MQNWRHGVDYRVYLVTDRALCLARSVPMSLEDVALAAVAGGAGVVQLREKDLCARDFVSMARVLAQELQSRGVPLIINDRVDIALASGAAGVHVGQSDMLASDARLLMGNQAIVGLSVENRADLLAAAGHDIDYVGISPVFSTPTKNDTAPPWGLEGLKWAKAHSAFPLVAIGGIHSHNAVDVLRAGADSLAVVSEICAAADPELAARDLLTTFYAAQEK